MENTLSRNTRTAGHLAKDEKHEKCFVGFVSIDLRPPLNSAAVALGASMKFEGLSKNEPAAVVVDIGSGYPQRLEGLATYKQSHPEAPTVGVTSWDCLRRGEAVLSDDISDLILYPIQSADLQQRLSRYVGGASMSENSSVLRFGDLAFNVQLLQLAVGSATLKLTAKEYALLLYLARQNERPVAHKELGKEALKIPVSNDTIENTVNVHAARIRTKLREASLERWFTTVRGQGFVLRHTPAS